MIQKTSKAATGPVRARPYTLAARVRTLFKTGPLYAWRFRGPGPETLSHSVDDLIPGNIERAREIYLGLYSLHAGRVDTGTHSPFTLTDQSPGWRAQLHSFEWLRHLTATDNELMSGNARALVDDWQQACLQDVRTLPWQPAIVARRLNSFLRHAPMILRGSNQAFYRRFCGLIARHVRFLRSVARSMEPGPDRLRIYIALMITGVSVPMSAPRQKRYQTRLERDLDNFILPDGMPVTRNIDDGVRVALDLLSLVAVMAKASYPVPDAVSRALNRLFPAINAMRHSDGSLATFNGSGAVPRRHIKALLNLDPTKGSLVPLEIHGGYRRLETQGTCVIADTGTLPPAPFDVEAMAGATSFEMSSDGHRFIVNAGSDPQRMADRMLMIRASAAHSAAVLDDISTAHFSAFNVDHDAILCALSKPAPGITAESWNVDDWRGFQTGHDAYAKQGYAYDRGMRLSADGNTIEGFDRFSSVAKAKHSPDNLVTLRFHLHPDIAASKDAESGTIIIWPKNSDQVGWVFAVRKAAAHLEQSIRFDCEGGPRQSKAIVVTFRPADHDMVFWRFDRKKSDD